MSEQNTRPGTPTWHNEPWVRLLQDAREEHGPAKVGRMIGYSAATVIGVSEGKYGADPSGVRQAVLERLGSEEVECPILGTIALGMCGDHRRAPFAASNPLRVQLWKACRTCPNNPNRTPE